MSGDAGKDDGRPDSARARGWGSINKWWFASAAFMVALGLGLAVIFWPSHRNDATPQPTTPPAPASAPGTPTDAPTTVHSPTPVSPAPSTTGAPAGWSDAGCNGAAGSDAVPKSAPKTQWEPLGGSAVPASDRYGPATVHGAVRQCYQHSPTGAAFAAATITTALGAAPEQATKIITAGMSPGEERDSMLADARNGDTGSYAQSIAAFRVGACTATRCNVDAVFTVNGGQLVRTTFVLVWKHGDWLIDGGSSATEGVSPVDQVPAGFIPWGQG